MDFGLSDDQRLLEETVRGFLDDRVPITRVRELCDEACPNDRGIWKALAELGMTGILVPEAQGGSGLTLLDAALVSQSLGHAVTPTPFLSSVVMVPVALGALDGAEVDAWLGGIAGGEIVFGLAVTESFSIREGAGVALEGGCLRGKAMMALDACGADRLLLAIGGDRLAVIRGDAPGLESTRLATIDATRCSSELLLDGVAPEAVFEDAGNAIARMLDAGRIALAADSLGACEAMIEQAVAYAKQRKQFGRVIGSFQAVKHMCAEMIAELEPARSLLWYAAHSIGWTDEQNLHFWFKRIGVARHLLGGPELLRDRAAAMQGLAAAP
jgi:alkylation response protein AidB-like acyl-CoA dehydrogenase